MHDWGLVASFVGPLLAVLLAAWIGSLSAKGKDRDRRIERTADLQHKSDLLLAALAQELHDHLEYVKDTPSGQFRRRQ